ncbi:MAG: hypothetical protein R2883_05595 [Caldisericia bacterium]
MKKIIELDVESLGRMLAEYCVSQGWAEQIEDNRIILNETGINKLSGPPYFFDVSNPDLDLDEPPSDFSSSTSMFTWHQKNFTPGKTKAPSARTNKPQTAQPDIHNWKPGQLTETPKIGFGNWQTKPQTQKRSGQGKKKREGSSGGGTIKMKTKLPPIAQARKFKGKKRKNSSPPKTSH